MSQTTAILNYLEAGNALTPLDALRMFNCLRLSGRIQELRDAGHAIITDMVEQGGKRYAKYTLRRPEQREMWAA